MLRKLERDQRGFWLLLVLGVIGAVCFLATLIFTPLRLLASPAKMATGVLCVAVVPLCAVGLAMHGRAPAAVRWGIAAVLVAALLYQGVHWVGMFFFPRVEAVPYMLMEELTETGYALDRLDFDTDESLFLHRQALGQRLSADAPAAAEIRALHYERYQVKAAGLYDFCCGQLMRQVVLRERGELIACDPLPWGAEAAWVLAAGEGEARPVYVLGYPGVLVQIGFDRAPTAAMMAEIGARLG